MRGLFRNRGRLSLECLEVRNLLAFDPSGYEQASLEHLNRMRADPQGELDNLFSSVTPRLVARDPSIQLVIDLYQVDAPLLVSQLSALRAVPPLAWNARLRDSSEAHNGAMIAVDQQAHQLPGELDLGRRIANVGYVANSIGENVYAYAESVPLSHAAFAIDWRPGAPGIQNPASHRNNIMSAGFSEVGIAITEEYGEQTSVGPLVVTQNFGNRNDYRPQVLGVVWNDFLANGNYDPGEGMGAVTIRAEGPNGVFTTTTMSAGGYQMELPSGRYRMTASGGGLPGVLTANTAIVGTENIKIDFELSSATSNPAPVARGDLAFVDERGHVIVTVLANDIDNESDLLPNTVNIINHPLFGVAERNVFTGQIHYRPDPGFVGTDLLTYQVRNRDGLLSNPATVSVRTFFPTGDFNHNGTVDGGDIDSLFAQVNIGSTVARYDLSGNDRVTLFDVEYLIEDVLGTHFGDANLDGAVDAIDYGIWNNHRFTTQNTSWSRGDFNGDRLIDGADFMVWFKNRTTAVGAANLAAERPVAVIDTIMADITVGENLTGPPAIDGPVSVGGQTHDADEWRPPSQPWLVAYPHASPWFGPRIFRGPHIVVELPGVIGGRKHVPASLGEDIPMAFKMALDENNAEGYPAFLTTTQSGP